MICVSILGASGYVGGELLRLIAGHPVMDVKIAFGATAAGMPIAALHPHLALAYPDMRFAAWDAALLKGSDLILAALPHGETQRLADDLLARLQALQAHTAGVTLEVKAWMKRPPYEKTAATAALLKQAQQCAAAAGFTLEDVPMTGGASDGNFTAAIGIPTLDGLGVPGDGAHALHEHFYLSSLAPRLAFWTSLLKELS